MYSWKHDSFVFIISLIEGLGLYLRKDEVANQDVSFIFSIYADLILIL